MRRATFSKWSAWVDRVGSGGSETCITFNIRINVGSGRTPSVPNYGSLSRDSEARFSSQTAALLAGHGFPESPSLLLHVNTSIPIGLLPSTCWICCNNGQLSELLTRQVISRDECHLVTVRKPSISSIFMSPYIRLRTDLRRSLLAQHMHFHDSPRLENCWFSKVLPLRLMTKPSIVGRVPDHPPM